MPSAASRSSIPRGRTLAWARAEPAVREAEQTQRFASLPIATALFSQTSQLERDSGTS
jgi:hypothetical protein